MTDDPDGRLLELTPVQLRRLEASLQIQETPAEQIAYQHSVLCQTCAAHQTDLRSGVGTPPGPGGAHG